MSDKESKAKSDTTMDSGAVGSAATLSMTPAMDLSLEAVTVPPPPTSGAAGTGSLGIPRAPRVPQENKPGKRKRSEDDIFSVFDVDSNAASDDIPVSVQFDKKPDPAQDKPKTQLGSLTEEREVTRNRSIPLNQEDLFNFTAGLFSTPEQAPLVAPDMSALMAPGLSDKAPTKPASTSAFDDLALGNPSAAVLAPVEPKAFATTGQTETAPRTHSHRKVLVLGIVAAAVVIGGVFYWMQTSSTEPSVPVAQPGTTEAPLDTRPGQTPATDEPRVAKPDTLPNKPAEDKSAPPTGTGGSPKDSSDKPAKATDSDKQGAAGKPSEAEANDKPAEPEEPTGPTKAQSLAEAMAAATAPGGGGTPPPPSTGSEFNKSAASAALNAAAGSAAGCKAPGDPSGVARVSVTFSPSGRVTRALVSGPPFAGTTTGGCVANAFKGASVPPFSGDPVTVSKSVSIR